MPGTLPDPTMPGSSAVLMPVSTTTDYRTYSLTAALTHAEVDSFTPVMTVHCTFRLNISRVGVAVQFRILHVTIKIAFQDIKKDSSCRNEWFFL